MRSDMQFAQWGTYVAPTPAWACVVVGSIEQLSAFLQRKADADIIVRVISGESCDSKQSLLGAISAALEFPTQSSNWNSFEDWLRDLTWLPSPSYIVTITKFALVLPSDDDYATFMDLARDAGTAGVRTAGAPPAAGTPAKLTFVFQVDDDDEARLVWKRLLPLRISSPAFYRLP